MKNKTIQIVKKSGQPDKVIVKGGKSKSKEPELITIGSLTRSSQQPRRRAARQKPVQITPRIGRLK